MNIEDRLKNIRKTNGLSQKDMAKMLGVSERSYVSYEQNAEKIQFSLLLSTAKIFSVNPVWLLTGQGQMIQTQSKHNPDVIQDKEGLKLAPVIQDHMEAVKRFKNHEKAKQINEKLIELEELNEDLLDDVDDQINIMLKTARKMSARYEKKTVHTGDYQGPDRRGQKAS